MEYKIGKRQRTNFIDDRGIAVDGYRVFYEMEDGTVDYVEVEKKQYSAPNVKKAIDDEVAIHEELVS